MKADIEKNNLPLKNKNPPPQFYSILKLNISDLQILRQKETLNRQLEAI